MNQEDLLKMLNIKPAASKQPVSVSPIREANKPQPETAVSQQALELDQWDVSNGAKVLRHNQEAKETGMGSAEMADFFSMGFLTNPTPVGKCIDERRLEFVTKTLDSPDFRGLHRATELNPIASELAAVEWGKGFSKLREKDNEQKKKQEEEKRKGKKSNAAKEAIKASRNLTRSVGQAIQHATKAVDDLRNAMETLGVPGCGTGMENSGQLDVGKVASIFERIKDSEQLRKIIDKAGAVRTFAQGAQRRKVKHGLDDMVGVVLDGDISRLLPVELAQLVIPELELDVTRRIVEKQAMCREYRGVEKVGKGPVVICLDKSGSMQYLDRIIDGCAFCLGMAYNARHQGRWCALVGFAGGKEGDVLILPPHKWDESRLLDWLSKPASGGTTLDVPVEELPTKYWSQFLAQGAKRGRTDLTMITDAIVDLPQEMEKKFMEWKKAEQVRCTIIVLGGKAGDLAKISDELYEDVQSLGLEQEAIQKGLSV